MEYFLTGYFVWRQKDVSDNFFALFPALRQHYRAMCNGLNPQKIHEKLELLHCDNDENMWKHEKEDFRLSRQR
jgi:hypothetical protein